MLYIQLGHYMTIYIYNEAIILHILEIKFAILLYKITSL